MLSKILKIDVPTRYFVPNFFLFGKKPESKLHDNFRSSGLSICQAIPVVNLKLKPIDYEKVDRENWLPLSELWRELILKSPFSKIRYRFL